MGSPRLFAPGEGRKVLALMLSMCLLAHYRRKELRKRWLSSDTPESDLRVGDHPVLGYLFENLWGAALAFAPLYFLNPPNQKDTGGMFLHFLIKSIWLVEPSLLVQKIACETIWRHVPYFSPHKPSESWRVMLSDWLQCNLVTYVATAGLQTFLLGKLPKAAFERNTSPDTPMRLLPVLGKFLLARLLVDVFFGIVHRGMHEIKWVYEIVHKRHHEHTTPRTQTNHHFEPVDLFLEAAFPIILTQLVFARLKIQLSALEQAYIFTALGYYEQASHTGKEAPIVTWFPLLSPLVQLLTGSDTDLILYHTSHHRLFNCNYSISPWPDRLMGTYKMTEKPKGPYEEETEEIESTRAT